MSLIEWTKRISNSNVSLETLQQEHFAFKHPKISEDDPIHIEDSFPDGFDLDLDVDEQGDGAAALLSHVENGETVQGRLKAWSFHGIIEHMIPYCSRTEIVMKHGRKEGLFRKFMYKDKFQVLGQYKNGTPIGVQWIRKEGGSWLVGQVDCQGWIDDQHGIYLYPDLKHAIIGHFKKGNLVKGFYGTVTGMFRSPALLPVPLVQKNSDLSCSYEPSTSMRICQHPLVEDPYEHEMVEVRQSQIPYAGQGLFAKRLLKAGDLVCLFNGIKCRKTSRVKMIKPGSDEWSDYRVTLDSSLDLDIPDEFLELNAYRATLGHKACHSFMNRNARFQELFHPRFGLIMSIVAVKDIEANDEILVNYNYDLSYAPQWYQDEWQKVKRILT